MSKLKIVSWNCCWQSGAFTGEKHDKIRSLFSPIDILVVQECSKTQFDVLKSCWKHKNWYGDDYEYSDYGVAVFSNTCKIEFTDTFNRNIRYVVPFTITHEQTKFTLFAVWIKRVPYDREEYDNIFRVTAVPEYKSLIANGAVLIGDLNTFAKKDNTYYETLCKHLPGFSDVITKEGKPPLTYYSGEHGFGADDFCFASGKLINQPVRTHIDESGWDDNQNKCRRWRGLSDHCPIIVEFGLEGISLPSDSIALPLKDKENIIRLDRQGWSVPQIAAAMKTSPAVVEIVLQTIPKE